jgi:Co/Zn/Cd efflux system component
LFLFLLTQSYFGGSTWAQQPPRSEESSKNTSSQTANQLDTMNELVKRLRHGMNIQLYLTIIVFMMGLAFVIFGLYIGQEQKLSIFTRRLYLLAYFSLIVPVTVILVRYIVSTLLSGTWNDPVLTVAFLLLIPVTASYVLMIAKSRHDIVRRQ